MDREREREREPRTREPAKVRIPSLSYCRAPEGVSHLSALFFIYCLFSHLFYSLFWVSLFLSLVLPFLRDFFSCIFSFVYVLFVYSIFSLLPILGSSPLFPSHPPLFNLSSQSFFSISLPNLSSQSHSLYIYIYIKNYIYIYISLSLAFPTHA